MRKTPVVPGSTWGLLTVIKAISKNEHSHVRWLCRCRCGRKVEVWGFSLVKTNGNTRSCGLGECLAWVKNAKKLARAEEGL